MFNRISTDLLKTSNKIWYRNAEIECDLFIWEDDNKKVKRFQVWQEENLIEWDVQSGFKSGQLDPAEGSFRSYQSPSYKYHPAIKAVLVKKIAHLLKNELFSAKLDSSISYIIELIESENKIK